MQMERQKDKYSISEPEPETRVFGICNRFNTAVNTFHGLVNINLQKSATHRLLKAKYVTPAQLKIHNNLLSDGQTASANNIFLTLLRMSVLWNVNLHPNSQAGGLSLVDNRFNHHRCQRVSINSRCRVLQPLSPTFDTSVSLNACKLSKLQTNIYINIICVLTLHLISVSWASHVAVMMGSEEWSPSSGTDNYYHPSSSD